MSGLVHDNKPSYFPKSTHQEIVLPELPMSSSASAGAEGISRSKSKKKRDKYKEKNKSRKKRSRSCPGGVHSQITLSEQEYLTKIHEDGRLAGDCAIGGKDGCRLPSILESPRKFPESYSLACSSNSEIDHLFSEKLNISSSYPSDRSRAVSLSERPKRDIAANEKPAAKSEEKKKGPKKATLLVSIKPENQDTEMDKFMKTNFSYNPVFEYKYTLNTGALDRFRKASDELIPVVGTLYFDN